MKTIFFSVACLALLGCAGDINDSTATYKPQGTGFAITLTGTRGNMAHDPISLMFRGSSYSTLVLAVPRLSGEVDGSEIPVPKGNYAYLGKVRFSPPYMDVELHYNDTDRHIQRATSWNGRYLLKPSGD